MDAVDQEYRETAEAAGLPLEAMHRLKPAEMRVLQYLAQNRGRIVAEPELAQHVFGESSREAALRVSRLLLPVRLAARRQTDIRPMLTYYRGELAVGLRWQAKEVAMHQPAENPMAA
jgi:hypothetical protein